MSNSKRKAHCNKKPHATMLAAQIALKNTLRDCKKRGDPIVTGLNAYKCPYCPKYHVGRSQAKGINWALVEAVDAKLKKSAVSSMDRAPGFYPDGDGSIPSRQANGSRGDLQ